MAAFLPVSPPAIVIHTARVLHASLSLPAWTVQAGAPAPADPDELYRHRDDPASADRARAIYAERAASGTNFEALWKLARAEYWLGTHGPEASRRTALEAGVDAGTKASALQPNAPEGHFWMAANMGALAESFGLSQGLKYRGRIKDELLKVQSIDEAWQQGSADRALGWWYHRVPGLFGGSESKAEELLRKALTYNMKSTATLYFLAEVLTDRGKNDEARRTYQAVLDAPLDPDWTPEDRDFKAKAKARLSVK